jgi:UDP-glucose 4-epimerase
LTHEIKKYPLCENTHAKAAYGWEPKVGMSEGLTKLIAAEIDLLDKYQH